MQFDASVQTFSIEVQHFLASITRKEKNFQIHRFFLIVYFPRMFLITVLTLLNVETSFSPEQHRSFFCGGLIRQPLT